MSQVKIDPLLSKCGSPINILEGYMGGGNFSTVILILIISGFEMDTNQNISKPKHTHFWLKHTHILVKMYPLKHT